MKTHKMLRGALVAASIVSCLTFASSASAIIINGTFSLVAGSVGFVNTTSIAAGTEVATGSFTTQNYDPTNPLQPANGTFNYSPPPGTFNFTAVELASFELTDIFGNTFLGGSDDPGSSDFTAPEPFAVLDAQGGVGSAVDFLVGDTGLLFGFNPTTNSFTSTRLILGFDQNGVTGEYLIAGGSAGGFNAAFLSTGNQVIPEPSGIALIGAGLLAFGAIRRRKAS